MNTTKYLSLAALALMGTLASCQSDDEAATNSFARPDNAVGINVTVGSLKGTTRSNPTAGQYDDKLREFNAGDQVCVSTDGQDPVLFQCTDADMQTWAEAVSGKFLLWTQNEMTFKAYYPATDGTSMTNFTLPADQSTEAKIAQADYMIRQQTCYNDNGTDIDLDLERKMARVIVRIAGFTNQYDEGQQTVSNVRINSQFSDIADGNGQGDVTAVTPYMQGTGGVNTTYTALVVPGYDDDGATFITLTDALNNTLTVKGFHELREGYSYTFNLTVGKNKIEVASVTVQDWATGEILPGGQAQEQTGPTYPIALSAVTADYVGSVVCSDGNVYPAKTAAPAGKTAVGILGKVTETGHGLILALKNATSQTWNTINGWTSVTTYAGTTLKVLPDDAARGTNLTSYTSLGETAVSNWAVAQKSDYETIFTNLGSTKNSGGMTYDNNVNAYITTGVGGTAMSGTYWSATQDDDSDAWYFQASSWYNEYKTDTWYVRPVLGFGGEAVPVTAITLNKTATSIMVGSTETLSVTAVAPDNATDKTYTWKTSDASKATVDQDGKVTAVAVGTVTIYAEANDGSGVTATCAVTVTLAYPVALSAVTSEYVGSVVTSDGNVYPAKTAVPAGKTAVGILGKVTATGHGLILALKDAEYQNWETINGWASVDTYAGTTLKVLPDADARGSLASYTTLGSTAVSNWAVAQKSDYEAIFINLGSTVNYGDGTTYDANVNAYITTGVGGTAISYGSYWTATEYDDDNGCYFDNTGWDRNGKTIYGSVRPVLAF